jgi:hypothetical protein
MDKTLLLSLAGSLAATLVLEGLFALSWGLRRKDLALCALVNVLTNPVVVLCCHLARQWLPIWLVTLVLEGWAVATEAWLYCTRGDRIQHPVAFSILANGVSYGLGLLL